MIFTADQHKDRQPLVSGAKVIDATGKYVMPGLINRHGHLHDNRAGKDLPVDYVLKLWLACGITTVRDLGLSTRRGPELRQLSEQGKVPRLFLYPVFNPQDTAANEERTRERIRELKKSGADGVKFFGLHRDVMAAAADEAHRQGLRIAHHAGVEETNAKNDIEFGTTSIEHWYGIPDAALLTGLQNFPSSYNYLNESDRFRWAGRLWREADWNRLLKVLDGLVAAKVAWVPTLNIYEASRDLQRAETQPWFAEYLHLTLAEFFRPSPENHGSYFTTWTSTDEAFWKENYQIWFRALREFEARGGVIDTGEDFGFIYQMYGFGLRHTLELHQGAGFQTLKIIQHATHNGARISGQERRLGQVRTGFSPPIRRVKPVLSGLSRTALPITRPLCSRR